MGRRSSDVRKSGYAADCEDNDLVKNEFYDTEGDEDDDIDEVAAASGGVSKSDVETHFEVVTSDRVHVVNKRRISDDSKIQFYAGPETYLDLIHKSRQFYYPQQNQDDDRIEARSNTQVYDTPHTSMHVLSTPCRPLFSVQNVIILKNSNNYGFEDALRLSQEPR